MNRKNIRYSLFIILFLTLNFSCYVKKQEFSVYNFKKLVPKTFADSTGLRFMYDVKMKHFFKFSQTYYIFSEIYDENSKKVFSNTESNQLSIFGNKESWDSINENLQIFIPYDKLELPSGEHNVELKLKVEGKRVPKGFIFNKKININKPELFHYKDQEIIVNELQKSEGYNDLSFFMNFDLKFKAYQTIGISENKDLQTCYLKADLYNKNTGELIEFASYTNPTLNKINAVNNTDKSCFFSISISNLNLPAGKYNIICKIKLTNTNNEDLSVLHEIEFPFTMPQLYLTEVNMKDLKLINEKQYDASTLAGRIFSGKDKNRGEGFPDVYWEVKTNNEKKFKSKVNNNSFTGLSGTANFITDDTERIYLSICDEDIGFINKYDLIGKFNIKNKPGEFVLSFNEKKIGNTKCSFDFKKIKYDPKKDYYKLSGK